MQYARPFEMYVYLNNYTMKHFVYDLVIVFSISLLLFTGISLMLSRVEFSVSVNFEFS